MKRRVRIIANKSVAVIVGFCLAAGVSFAEARAAGADVDVYVVFSGKNKGDKSKIKKLLPKELPVKYYNVDLLALADYSGKQKAIAKLERAKIIVLIKDAAMELLQGAFFRSNLVIVESCKNTVISENSTFYVLGNDTI